jgi:outer membrane protein, heavy metal efflux system
MRVLRSPIFRRLIVVPIAWAISTIVSSAQEPASARAFLLPPQELTPASSDASTPSRNELSLDALVDQVLARNPSLAQMAAAQQAAAARYPQVTSLDDPMVGAYAAPGSFGSNEVSGGYRVEVSQKFLFPGKRALRGENALASARAASDDVEDMRLQLVESTKIAFYEYFLVERAQALNDENLRLLREVKRDAENRFRTGLSVQQDVLQAEVEIGRQLERQIELEHLRKISQARLNTLTHSPPDTPLPPPPALVELRPALPDPAVLRSCAVSRRPDVQALANRIAAEEATLALALKEHYPDIEVMAAYDTYWQERPLQTTVGVRVNLPVRYARRQGAIEEARAKIAERRAELALRIDQINFQVQEAYEQVQRGEKTIRLYQATILPAAEANLQAARTAYATGKLPFLSLIEAQRSIVALKDRYFESVTSYRQRLATLERVVGGRLDGSAPSPPASSR